MLLSSGITLGRPKLLGRVSARALAARLGLKKRAVAHHRRGLGIAAL